MIAYKEHKNYKVKRRIVSDYFNNVSLIHPLKQKQVFKLISNLKGNKNINKIVIFGSSVTNRCRTGSDLDFYVDMSEQVDLNKLLPSILSNYDYWNNYTVDKRLLSEIEKKGVVVYERENYA